MYENIFNRVEQKYILTNDQREELLKIINDNLEKDKYYESLISNVYFDDSNNRLIVNSLDKPLYKDKVRIRSYGNPDMDSDVFFEVKYKYNGIVSKRRIKLKLIDFYNYLEGKLTSDKQIMKELDYLVSFYDLKPVMFIGYHRYSYKGKEDSNLRITFDDNLTSRRDDLKLESGMYGEKYFDDNKVIMEIKTLHGYPMWLVKALSKLKIYPNSFSKYGSIYSKEKVGNMYA